MRNQSTQSKEVWTQSIKRESSDAYTHKVNLRCFGERQLINGESIATEQEIYEKQIFLDMLFWNINFESSGTVYSCLKLFGEINTHQYRH